MSANSLRASVAALIVACLGFSASAKDHVPINGEFVTEFAFVSPPPVAQVILTGSGLVSHLGKATCFSPDEVVDFTQQPLPTLKGTLELTAANGDTLIGEMDCLAVPAPDGSITFAGTLTFTGGTGRFEGATGSAELSGQGSPTSAFGGVGWFAIDGNVSSPGASKK